MMGEYGRWAYTAALVLAVFLLVRFMDRHSRSPDSAFRFGDLLIGDDGRASKAAAVMYGSWLVSSWVLIYITLNKPDLVGATFTVYTAVWATPAVTALIVNAWKQAPAPTNVSVKNVEGDVNVPKPITPQAAE